MPVAGQTRLSRRSLAILGALGVLGGSAPGRVAAQDDETPWQVGNGIRLAGPISGPASLDPALSRETQSNTLLQQLYRGLVSLDADLAPVPELASNLDVSSDALRIDVTLRSGVAFHDGRAIDPADVVASFSRALNPATTGGNAGQLPAAGFLGDIVGADQMLAGTASTLEGVEITGDSTLSIALSRPTPAFLAKLTSVTASIVDAVQVAGDPDWHLNPNGSGPYRFDAWTPGSSLLLQPADTWWAGAPVSGPLSYLLGSSAVLPANLYRSGEVDLVWSVPPEIVDLVEDPGSGYQWGELTEVGLFSTMYIAFSNQIAPLDDLHLRRALQHVFPAGEVATVMYQGAVSIATGLVPPGMHGLDWSVAYPEPDLDAARSELAKSRFGSADRVPPISIHAADIRPVEAFRDVAGDLLGLRVEAIEVPWFDFLDGLSASRFMAYAINWTADYPDAASMLEMLFASTSGDNGAGYVSETFDAMLDEARQATGDARLAILVDANRHLIEDVALIPLYHDVGHALVREGLSGLRVTPIGLLGFESVHGLE